MTPRGDAHGRAVSLPAALADLPIVEVLDDLGAALDQSRSAIVVAPPGAGKTTAIPVALLQQSWAGDGRIVMLEPRRLATRAAAHRMADVLGERVGETVGYQTRDERHIGARTRIEVVTEGVLTRRLQHDPSLAGTAAVLFDEVHERNLPTDLGLALALDARGLLCPDLRIVAMSATPDVDALRRVLGDVPVVVSDGRQHPVEVRWVPGRRGQRIEAAVADAVRRALAEELGDVLVFLPGIGEIRRVEALLGDLTGVELRPLAGALPASEQDAALAPSTAGTRRVVLSTDIAESSLTVRGVRVVVDAGLARVPRHDVRTGMTRLTTVATSRASADQRAGRAGRTEPGVCYRLWSKVEHTARPAHLAAEITQVDLSGLALELAAWGTPADELAFVDPPPRRALQQGHELLLALGATTSAGRLTDTGRRMVELPLHPRLARMVVGADPGDRSLACVVAAVLDDRDVFRGRPADLPADLALRVAAVAGRGHHDAADRGALRRAGERAADISRRSGHAYDTGEVDPDHTGRVTLLGFPDRLAVRRSQPGNFQLRTGTMATVERSDSLAGEAFVVAADVDGDRRQARIRMAAALGAAEIVDVLAEQVEVRAEVILDKARNDLVERRTWRLGGMVLDEQVRQPTPGPTVTAALLERIRGSRLAALGGDGAATLRARVEFLRATFGDRWPDWSDAALLAHLDDPDGWLVPHLAGMATLIDVAALDVGMVLASQLDWDTTIHLGELAPTELVTPAGRAVPIDYRRARPTASVRVQDLFGLSEHPTVAGGRVPLTLELLSPADRPIQVTADLPGFWAESWAAVRTEMAGRYPKHQWPLDPAAASPRRLK